jgi:LCP family protein required for cell wall assembly
MAKSVKTKPVKAPIRTPYRQQTGYKWYIYVLVGFASLCLMLSALVASFILSGKSDSNIFKQIFDEIVKPGGKQASAAAAPVSEDFNVLIAGLDDLDGRKRSDTIIVGRVSTKNKYANFVFIPRDTFVDIPGHGRQKINSAYAYGEENLLVETIEEYMGVHIDYYFVVNLDAFVALVDAMGGIDVTVEKRMKYRDRRGGLDIDLQAGAQHLDGDQVMQYARFRHDAEGDFGRIERQQKLLQLFARKFRDTRTLSKIPDMLNALERHQLKSREGGDPPMMKRNMTINDIAALAGYYDKAMSRNINHYTLPGVPDMIKGASVVIADEKEMPYLVAGALKGGYTPDNEKIKVQVLNGCRQRGIADIFARRLGYFGFDIINTDNADSFDYENTVVVMHRQTAVAKKIARIFNAELRNEIDPQSLADISVIIGRDKL